MQSYEVARATGVCASTGRAFEVGEAFIASLWMEPGSEKLQRSDFSLDAWASGARPSGQLFGSWRSVLSPPNTRRRMLIDDNELLDLFLQLGGAGDVKRQAFRYVLALILVRKRLLRVEGSAKRGVLVVRTRPVGGAASGEPGVVVEVVDPGMDEAMVAEATEQLSAIVANDEPVKA